MLPSFFGVERALQCCCPLFWWGTILVLRPLEWLPLFFPLLLADDPANAGKAKFLAGESMGGAVVLCMHLREPQAWQGAVLIAPMCKVMQGPLVACFLLVLSPFPSAIVSLSSQHPDSTLRNEFPPSKALLVCWLQRCARAATQYDTDVSLLHLQLSTRAACWYRSCSLVAEPLCGLVYLCLILHVQFLEQYNKDNSVLYLPHGTTSARQ